MDPHRPTLVFVYNADGGLLSRWADRVRRVFSIGPRRCRLSALLHSQGALTRQWRGFLAELEASAEVLHRDELQRYAATIRSKELSALPLPAVMLRTGDGPPRPWIGAEAIARARTSEQLQLLIELRWRQLFPWEAA